MTSIRDFFEAIKKQDGFNYISNNGQGFSKSTLFVMLRELLYAIETDHNGLMEIDRRYIYDILLENLENELKDEEYTDW